MRTILLAYGVTAAVFLVLDFIWLGTMVNAYYKPRMGELLLEQPRLGVAVLFYAIYVVGVVAFAVLPALREGDWTRALWGGALFGFCAYATYDMTNLATLKGFSSEVALVDMVWGTVVSGASATLGMLGVSLLTRAG
jgi:uncharacterized membrane protein